MKVIKAGNINYDKPWVGKKIECSRCHAIFELDANDSAKFHSDWRDGDFYEISCPTCKERICFSL